MLQTDAQVITQGQDDSFTPDPITFYAYYSDGQTAENTPYAGRFVIQETTDGTSYTTIYTSQHDETSRMYSPTNPNVKNVRCTLYASGGTTNALDMQGVAIVRDVDNLTQEEVFNILTNNRASQGIYMQDGNLYINGTYIKGGIISGQTIEGGSFTTYNNGYLASRLTGTGIKFYDWSGDRSFVGAIESIHNSQLNRGNVAFYSDENSSVTIGYTTDDPEEPNASITPVMSFDPQKPTSTPHMINTSNGTLFNHNPNGGIVVENGLLKKWSIKSVLDNTLNVISSLSWNGNGELTSVQKTSVDIRDGLIVGWTVKTFDV